MHKDNKTQQPLKSPTHPLLPLMIYSVSIHLELFTVQLCKVYTIYIPIFHALSTGPINFCHDSICAGEQEATSELACTCDTALLNIMTCIINLTCVLPAHHTYYMNYVHVYTV